MSESQPTAEAPTAQEPYYRIESYDASRSLGYLIKRSYVQMLDCIEPVFAQRGFTYTQWVVMKHLRDGKGMNPKDISCALRHDSGALTRVLDQLESRGLIRRERSNLDRRAVEVYLTEEGQQCVDSFLPHLIDRMNTALGHMSHAEADQLIQLLIKLTEGPGMNGQALNPPVGEAGDTP